jgi:hypothetical protein
MLRNKYRILLLMVLVIPLLVHADCRPISAQQQDIQTEELEAMIASGQAFVLINVLPKIIYDSMHLPGSINYPIGKLEQLADLPFQKNIPLVFYCMGYL